MAITHCSWDSVAPSSRDSVGMVTLRLVLPTKTISRLRHSTARIHQRRRCTFSSIGLARWGAARVELMGGPLLGRVVPLAGSVRSRPRISVLSTDCLRDTNDIRHLFPGTVS